MTTDWNNGFDSGILPQSHTNSNPASNVLNNTFELDHEDSTYLRWASSSPVYLPDPMSPDMCYASFMDTMCLSGNLESTPGDGSSASPSSPELASPKLEQKSVSGKSRNKGIRALIQLFCHSADRRRIEPHNVLFVSAVVSRRVY